MTWPMAQKDSEALINDVERLPANPRRAQRTRRKRALDTVRAVAHRRHGWRRQHVAAAGRASTMPSHDFAQYWRLPHPAPTSPATIAKMDRKTTRKAGVETPVTTDFLLCGFRIASMSARVSGGATVDHDRRRGPGADRLNFRRVRTGAAPRSDAHSREVMMDDQLPNNLTSGLKFGPIWAAGHRSNAWCVISHGRGADLGARHAGRTSRGPRLARRCQLIGQRRPGLLFH